MIPNMIHGAHGSPPNLLAGMAGPGGMAGNMTPGMGPSPMGAPGGGAPPAAMRALDQLAAAPAGQGEQQLMQECSANLKAASARVIMRSPRAAQEIAKAVQSVDKALELLAEEQDASVGLPPDLLGGLTPSPMGSPGAPPMGGGGM